MKLMFVGAILASSTNLIFIGLVKSAQPIEPVTVQVGQQTYQLNTDEIGAWQVDIDTQQMLQAQKIEVSTAYQNQAETIQVSMPYQPINLNQAQLIMLPVTNNNEISSHEKTDKLVVRGQYLGPALTEQQKLQFKLDDQVFDANLGQQGIFSTAIDAKVLADSKSKTLEAVLLQDDNAVLQMQQQYLVTDRQSSKQDLDLQIMPIVLDQSQAVTTIKGKVIQSYSSGWLYFAIIVDNLASGLAGAAFIAFLSSLTSVSFTAVQYALFSSLMTMTPKLLGGYSGTIVTNIGYPNFFLMTTLIGIPILLLIIWVGILLKKHETKSL